MAKKKPDAEQEIEESDKATVSGVETKLVLAKMIINQLKNELGNLERLLASSGGSDELENLVSISSSQNIESIGPAGDGKILEGGFDGQNMIGSEGRPYIEHPNYASKYKLVEGDILKLTIQANGTFLYKQIGPIERQRVVGPLVRDEMNGDWRVSALGKKYNVLPAAVSYYKGNSGDDAVILIPKATPSKWAALENIVRQA